MNKYLPVADKYPSVLEIESTSRCNVNPPCPMCQRAVRAVTGYPEKDLPSPLIDWLSNAISSAKQISISGIGEPMMAAGFDKMVRLGSGADISFFSNAQIINQEHLDLIFDAKVTNIRISLDAATNETYRKIRGFSLQTFDSVKSNIMKITNEKEKRNVDIPRIVLIMVVMKENYQELPMLVELARELKASGVNFWEMRKPSVPTDYIEHDRHDFHFSYEEQSVIPDDFSNFVQKSKQLAADYGISFQEN